MRTKILGCVATLGLMAGTSANATILTFDDIPGTENIQTSLTYEGFSFSSTHFHTFGCGHVGYETSAFNNSTHLGYESGRGSPIVMSRSDGEAFSLVSLDASEFYAVNNPDRPNADILDITGYLLGGGTVSYQLRLDGLVDGIFGPLEDFEHFSLPDLFTNVTSIVFTGLRLNGSSGGINIDNLEVLDRVSVPEPATLGLFGMGLLGLGFARRRKAA